MSKLKPNVIFDESERLPEPDSPFSGYHFAGQHFVKSPEYVRLCMEIGKQVLGPYEEWLENRKEKGIDKLTEDNKAIREEIIQYANERHIYWAHYVSVFGMSMETAKQFALYDIYEFITKGVKR